MAASAASFPSPPLPQFRAGQKDSVQGLFVLLITSSKHDIHHQEGIIHPPKANLPLQQPQSHVMHNNPFISQESFNLRLRQARAGYFKKALFKSHFLTNDPSEAHLFYLPFSIVSLRHDERVGIGGIQAYVKNYVQHTSRSYPFWNRTWTKRSKLNSTRFK
ncbi:hypothetical protein SASPL_108743 [Salvia splendens]|uniref:Exostosin GT47 domain-containing protein n=1 Tax=Salvia splendens TaxID=180675 RepID=A0A8X8YDL9_SALSN|nr:hypothetical protein SASPL_108743 [Salvia splendens]